LFPHRDWRANRWAADMVKSTVPGIEHCRTAALGGHVEQCDARSACFTLRRASVEHAALETHASNTKPSRKLLAGIDDIGSLVLFQKPNRVSTRKLRGTSLFKGGAENSWCRG
jgi:hypothetical protein